MYGQAEKRERNRWRRIKWKFCAEEVEQAADITAKANGNRGCAEGIFKNQRPADNPSNKFAERRVAISVGAAGNRKHRGEFSVTKTGKDAADACDNE